MQPETSQLTSVVPAIVKTFELTLDFLRRCVADLDEDQMCAQPGGVVNHPAWTLGHLAYSCQAIGGELGLPAWLPAQWPAKFATGSEPSAEGYPAKAELLKVLDDAWLRVRTRLEAAEESFLVAPLPDVRYRHMLPTRAHAVIQILGAHAGYHAGQLSAWRRAMGLPPVSGFV